MPQKIFCTFSSAHIKTENNKSTVLWRQRNNETFFYIKYIAIMEKYINISYGDLFFSFNQYLSDGWTFYI